MSETDTDFGKFDSFRNDAVMPRSDLANLIKNQDSLSKANTRLEMEIERLKLRRERDQEKISDLETEMGKVQVLALKTDKELDRWTQRGITIWAIAGIIYGFVQWIYPLIKIGAQ